MIERFTKEQFEQALFDIHSGAEYLGFDTGEQVWAVPVTESARIFVRSSIDNSNIAADTGEDSIRLYIQVFQPNWRNPHEMIWQPAGKKVDAYTTRVPGWQDRMKNKIQILFDRAQQVRRPVNTCPKCGKACWVGFAKSNNRPFASHKDCDYFIWLDKPMEKGEVVKYEVPTSELAEEVPMAELPAVLDALNGKESAEDDVTLVRIDAEISSYKAAKKANKPADKPVKMTYDRQPNDSQLAAIEADVNANIRLMAPPGSGKTFVIEHRYNYLVQSGISPEKILVVTYSKRMAEEMNDRIGKTCKSAFADHISTIHAFCYRLLTRWDASSKFYGWSVPKDWQQKKVIDELVEKYWQVTEDEEKPGWKEVMLWINNSKYHNLTVAESLQYFIENLGARFGNWLYQIRKEFDAQMANQKSMDFSDMLFHTEQLLKNDKNFRLKWQKKFSHVIIDEGQDTNAQAMRILITIGG